MRSRSPSFGTCRPDMRVRALPRAVGWLAAMAMPLMLVVAALLLAPGGAGATEKAAAPTKPVRFGVLPLGGAVESRALWMPLLADMSQAIGVPVTAYSVASY